jgi:hypothetical protein
MPFRIVALAAAAKKKIARCSNAAKNIPMLQRIVCQKWPQCPCKRAGPPPAENGPTTTRRRRRVVVVFLPQKRTDPPLELQIQHVTKTAAFFPSTRLDFIAPSYRSRSGLAALTTRIRLDPNGNVQLALTLTRELGQELE